MSPLLRPVQTLLLMFAGWVNRHQLDVIEYLQEENRVLDLDVVESNEAFAAQACAVSGEFTTRI